MLVVLEYEADPVGDQQTDYQDPQVEPRLPPAAEPLALFDRLLFVLDSRRRRALLGLVLQGRAV
jgi:hypothetical protein